VAHIDGFPTTTNLKIVYFCSVRMLSRGFWSIVILSRNLRFTGFSRGAYQVRAVSAMIDLVRS
jgi:hypothetical protein